MNMPVDAMVSWYIVSMNEANFIVIIFIILCIARLQHSKFLSLLLLMLLLVDTCAGHDYI